MRNLQRVCTAFTTPYQQHNTPLFYPSVQLRITPSTHARDMSHPNIPQHNTTPTHLIVYCHSPLFIIQTHAQSHSIVKPCYMLHSTTHWLRLSPKFQRQKRHYDQGVTQYQTQRNTLRSQRHLRYSQRDGSPFTTLNLHTHVQTHKAALRTLLTSPDSPNLPFATPQHANPTETHLHPIVQLLPLIYLQTNLNQSMHGTWQNKHTNKSQTTSIQQHNTTRKSA